MIWGVRARHGDEPVAYVKALTGDDYDILLFVSDGTKMQEYVLEKRDASSVSQLALRLK